MATRAVLGVLGAQGIATVDERGILSLIDHGIDLDWMVGSDGWRDASNEVGLRRALLPGAPIAISRLSANGGDIVQRSFGVAGSPPIVVVEFENEGSDAVALAVVLRATPGGRLRKFAATDRTLTVDDREVIAAGRPWQQWAVADDELTLHNAIAQESTNGGPLLAQKLKGQRNGCVGLVWPLPHHRTLQIALPLVAAVSGQLASVNFVAIPGVDAVARGWEAQLDRGMRVEIDDAQLHTAIDGARAALLLRSSAERPRPDADDAIALEDWGLDAEASAVWTRLSARARRAAGSREPNTVAPWVRVKTHLSAASGGVPHQSAKFLRAVRDLMLHEHGDGSVDVFCDFPAEWLGLNVAIHDAPLRRGGTVSFALRWHGGRPALLWDASHATSLRSPRLDPSWSVVAHGAGEQLLKEPPADLLALQLHGTPGSETGGRLVADPGSFS